MNAKRVLSLIVYQLVLVAATLSAQLSLEVSMEIDVQATNRIRNGRFESVNELSTHANYWTHGADKASFRITFPYKSDRQKRCAKLQAMNGIKWGYIQQNCAFTTQDCNKEFVVQCLVRQNGGRVGMEVSGCGIYETYWSDISSIALPVVGLFVPDTHVKKVNDEQQWRKVLLKFTPKTPGRLSLNLGSNRCVGTIWFDDVIICSAKTSLNLKVEGPDLEQVTVVNHVGRTIFHAQGAQLTKANDISVKNALSPVAHIKDQNVFERTIQNVDTFSCYHIIAIDGAGNRIEKWYPEEPLPNQV